VGSNIAGGHMNDLRVLTWEVRERFGVDVGVRMSLR
jgi:hypothetical protein